LSNIIQFTTIRWRKIICCSVKPTNVYAIINPEVTHSLQTYMKCRKTDRQPRRRAERHTEDRPSTDLLVVTITAL